MSASRRFRRNHVDPFTGSKPRKGNKGQKILQLIPIGEATVKPIWNKCKAGFFKTIYHWKQG